MYQRNQLDSRADTCIAGTIAVVIKYTGKTCDVRPYNPTYEAIINAPIVKAITAYCIDISETFILCINQALSFGKDMPNFPT